MLTTKQLNNLKGKKSAYRVWDGDGSGFGVRVTPAGGVSFFQFYYGQGGKRRFYGLGRYVPDAPEITDGDIAPADSVEFYRQAHAPKGLKSARRIAARVRGLVDQGLDPAGQEQEIEQRADAERAATVRAQQEADQRGTVEQLLRFHVEAMRRKGRTEKHIADFEGTVRRYLPEALLSAKVADVKPLDLAHRIAVPIKAGHVVMANRLRTYLHALFKTALLHDHDPANLAADVKFGLHENPINAIPKQETRENARDRDLEFWELARAWEGLTDPTAPGSPVTRAQIRLQFLLAGMHFTEVGYARWDEIDFMRRVWDIPARRGGGRAGTKNARPHVVPLSETALTELQQLYRLTGHAEWLFPHHKDESKPMAQTSPAQYVRKSLRPWIERKDKEQGREPMAPWSPANIRSTVKTRLGELGFNNEQRNRLQNHAQTGVDVKHYDRWDFIDEKREMVDAFALALRYAIDGQPVNKDRIRAAVVKGAAA